MIDSRMSVQQFLVGEAWHELMAAVIFATNGWIAIYFLSYAIVMTLLITNLLIVFSSAPTGKWKRPTTGGG